MKRFFTTESGLTIFPIMSVFCHIASTRFHATPPPAPWAEAEWDNAPSPPDIVKRNDSPVDIARERARFREWPPTSLDVPLVEAMILIGHWYRDDWDCGIIP
jgi:hypothetical protein